MTRWAATLFLGIFLGSVSAQEESSPTTTDKQAQLNALLEQYRNNEITPQEYQQGRQAIQGSTVTSADRPPLGSDGINPAPAEADSAESLDSSSDEPGTIQVAALATAQAAASVGSTSGTGLASALGPVLPGADLLIQFDLASARQAPIYRTLQAAQKDAAQSNAAMSPQLSQLTKELEQTLGLKEEDVLGMVISVDLEDVDSLQGETWNKLAEKVRGAMALHLAKPLSLAQMKAAIQKVADESETGQEITISESKLAGADILTVASSEPGEPSVHLAVPGGRLVLGALDQASLSQALQQAAGSSQALDANLAKAHGTIPANSQFKLSLVLPTSVQQGLRGMAASGGTGPGGEPGPAGMLGGLGDLRSITLGAHLSDALGVTLIGDLGNAQTANGLSMMLAMMKPQLLTSLAQSSQKTPDQLPADTFNISVNGTVLQIALKLDEAMLKAFSEQAGAAQAQPAPPASNP